MKNITLFSITKEKESRKCKENANTRKLSFLTNNKFYSHQNSPEGRQKDKTSKINRNEKLISDHQKKRNIPFSYFHILLVLCVNFLFSIWLFILQEVYQILFVSLFYLQMLQLFYLQIYNSIEKITF